MGASRSKYSVIIVGLDGAGKTTMLYNLRLGDVRENFAETNGFNYEVLERVYSKTRFQFHMFDLAGKEALRPLWKHFYRNLKPHVVVFVVDASDKERIGEAKKEFQKLLHESDLFNSVVIVLANQKRVVKTDPLDTQMKESDIRYEMEVPREVVVIEVDAQETHELTHVMHHICQQLLKNKS